jgi:hypothetical protein
VEGATEQICLKIVKKKKRINWESRKIRKGRGTRRIGNELKKRKPFDSRSFSAV